MFDLEKKYMLSILRMTKNGSTTLNEINNDSKIAKEIALKIIHKLQDAHLIELKDDSIEIDSQNRLNLAVKAIEFGADIQDTSSTLLWQEFEAVVATALRRNDYIVLKNMRFKHLGKRWEIDVLGCKRPIALSIDCKQWRRGLTQSSLRKIVETHVERTKALVQSLPNIAIEVECAKWETTKFIPTILSLISTGIRYCDKVPIVPVLQIQDFLHQLPAHIESVRSISRRFNHL